MKVKPIHDFIETRGTNIPIKALDHEKQYEVIIENKSVFGKRTFFLVDDMFTHFPMGRNSKLFQIVDQNKDGWATSKRVKRFHGTASCKAELLKLLINDPHYFEHLVGGESAAVESFKRIYPNVIAND